MLMLMLNNKLSFIYIGYIVKQQNLYGYLAIVAVAMFSLYIFWLVILSGSQITYAVQYMDFLSDDDAWNAMGPRMRAGLRLSQKYPANSAFAMGSRHRRLFRPSLSSRRQLSPHRWIFYLTRDLYAKF